MTSKRAPRFTVGWNFSNDALIFTHRDGTYCLMPIQPTFAKALLASIKAKKVRCV